MSGLTAVQQVQTASDATATDKLSITAIILTSTRRSTHRALH